MSWPEYSQGDLDRVIACVRSGKLCRWYGSENALFEKEFAEYIGCSDVVTVANGTVSLELILEALGVGPGDEVIVASRSFVATASSVLRVGAIPVFADISEISGNLAPEAVCALIRPVTKAVICVHVAGWPCDLNSLVEICASNGVHLVEDCAQAHGAKYNGVCVGGFGIASSFSFCHDKIMSAGEGGCICTSDRKLADRIRSLKDHGKDMRRLRNLKPGGFARLVHESLGTNARMPEISAAICRSQLERLDMMIEVRRLNYSFCEELFRRPNLQDKILIPDIPLNVVHAGYRAYFRIDPTFNDYFRRLNSEKLSARDYLVSAAFNAKMPVVQGSCSELYLENVFKMFWDESRLPVCKLWAETGFAVLIDPTQSPDSLSRPLELMLDW